MTEKTVDARGQICPKPLIMTKQALTESAVGAMIAVVMDNETSCQNVERFLQDNGLKPAASREGGLFTLRFAKTQPELAVPGAEAYCVPAGAGGTPPHVVLVTSDVMGRGPSDLGGLLMKGFINTIKEVAPLPSHLIFYSSGILLTVDDSPLAEPIRELERSGVIVLVCGTCADYYQKKNEIHVGTISNMYVILETLTAAGKVISP